MQQEEAKPAVSIWIANKAGNRLSSYTIDWSITNNTDKPLKNVYFEAEMYANGNKIATCRTLKIATLKPGQSAGFDETRMRKPSLGVVSFQCSNAGTGWRQLNFKIVKVVQGYVREIGEDPKKGTPLTYELTVG